MGEKIMKKLNFGCGSIQPKGWDNIDIEDFGQEFVGTIDLFAENTYDIIVAHASVQQFEWHDIVNQLKELHRILKPGGVIRISLPDIVRGFEFYQNGDSRFFPNSEEFLDEKFSAWLTWYSTSKSLMTERALMMKLRDAGFSEWKSARFLQSEYFTEPPIYIIQLDTRQGEFYFVEAKK